MMHLHCMPRAPVDGDSSGRESVNLESSSTDWLIGVCYFLAPNSASRASFCLEPRPRTRREAGDVELLHDLVSADLADPGHALEHAGDLHLAHRVVRVFGKDGGQARVATLELSLGLARLRRASAAFSNACWRCSGVRVGRGIRTSSCAMSSSGAWSGSRRSIEYLTDCTHVGTPRREGRPTSENNAVAIRHHSEWQPGQA